MYQHDAKAKRLQKNLLTDIENKLKKNQQDIAYATKKEFYDCLPLYNKERKCLTKIKQKYMKQNWNQYYKTQKKIEYEIMQLYNAL